MQQKSLRTRIWRVARWLGLAIVFGLIATVADAWSSFGGSAKGERRSRMEHSPQWKGGHFVNPQPLINDAWGSIGAMFNVSPDVAPKGPVPAVATRLEWLFLRHRAQPFSPDTAHQWSEVWNACTGEAR